MADYDSLGEKEEATDMKIGEASRTLKIPASTIRYYESLGLLGTQTRVSGRRELDQSATQMLRFIKLAKAAGFSLQDIKQLRLGYESGGSPQQVWFDLAQTKRSEILEKIQELQMMIGILDEMMSCQCETVSECLVRADKESADEESVD